MTVRINHIFLNILSQNIIFFKCNSH